MRAGNRLTLDDNLTLIGFSQAADDVEQRRLAAAGRSDDCQHFALRNAERNVIDSRHCLVHGGKALDNAIDAQDRVGTRGRGMRRRQCRH
jgi:hypothetical protein